MRGRLVAAMLLASCDANEVEVPAPDYGDFRRHVYPVLLRDCGLSRCHGDPDRFFVIWGPGRTRLQPEADEPPIGPFDPPTDAEIWRSYQRTRAALSHTGDVEQAPLLQKPLEGHAHAGVDVWGRNVWRRDDPRWLLVASWAAGEPVEVPEQGP